MKAGQRDNQAQAEKEQKEPQPPEPLTQKEEHICMALGVIFFICIVISSNAAHNIMNGSINVRYVTNS
jgi:hypothetical protein